MTAKRWEIIDEEFISYTGGTAQLISNGECKIHLWERPQDAQLFCDKLNELHEEKEIAIEGIQIANDLIMKYSSEELKHEWQKNVRVKE